MTNKHIFLLLSFVPFYSYSFFSLNKDIDFSTYNVNSNEMIIKLEDAIRIGFTKNLSGSYDDFYSRLYKENNEILINSLKKYGRIFTFSENSLENIIIIPANINNLTKEKRALINSSGKLNCNVTLKIGGVESEIRPLASESVSGKFHIDESILVLGDMDWDAMGIINDFDNIILDCENNKYNINQTIKYN